MRTAATRPARTPRLHARRRTGLFHGRRRGGSHCVAVDEQGNEPAVHVAGERDVLWARLETCDGLAVTPLALYAEAVGIEPPAAVAVGEVIGVEILKWVHRPRLE